MKSLLTILLSLFLLDCRQRVDERSYDKVGTGDTSHHSDENHRDDANSIDKSSDRSSENIPHNGSDEKESGVTVASKDGKTTDDAEGVPGYLLQAEKITVSYIDNVVHIDAEAETVEGSSTDSARTTITIWVADHGDSDYLQTENKIEIPLAQKVGEKVADESGAFSFSIPLERDNNQFNVFINTEDVQDKFVITATEDDRVVAAKKNVAAEKDTEPVVPAHIAKFFRIADTDRDKKIRVEEMEKAYSLWLGNVGKSINDPEWNPDYDFNDDGGVSILDWIHLRSFLLDFCNEEEQRRVLAFADMDENHDADISVDEKARANAAFAAANGSTPNDANWNHHLDYNRDDLISDADYVYFQQIFDSYP